MFLANKPLSKIYANFFIAEPKNKYDQVMGNSELRLKIHSVHFKVFSCHDMPEVE